ncbi:MAG: 50S ribosomal protein L9 [Rhodospirillales bacterium]|nr:50S ribosomal protein L9 [Alphaproteobacteria bacterium]MBL6947534.1 50S ribosomal protein L9 [Rhodospirillales bacterium]
MDIILLEKIDKLGQMGDVVKVKSGYARNFLLPHGKALRATEANKKHFDDKRAQLEASNLETRKDAEKLAEKLNGISVIMTRQAGEAGQLYGSVNARDIANGVTEAGFTISRQQVKLPHPIKALGLYDIRVSLHPEVEVKIVANVARSAEEAKIQTKTGFAVVSNEEEEAVAPAHTLDEEIAAAKEAAVEQAEEIFEEGAAPQDEPEEDTGEATEDKSDTEATAEDEKAGEEDKAE